MQGFTSYIPLLYLLVSIPYVMLGLYAWNRRPAVAVAPFAWMMVGMAVWSFGYYLEILVPSLTYKLLFVDFEYLGIVSLPTLLFAFALDYTGKNHLLTARHKIWLSLFPILILVLTWTNPMHGLMWTNPRTEVSSGLVLLRVNPGIFYWLNVIYSYLLLLLGTLLLIMEFLQRPGNYRFQISLVIVGLISPWVGNVIYLAGLSPIPNLDLTPLFFIPTSFALGWAITRFRFLEALPLEHISVLQNMRDGVIVVDIDQRILYMNPIAELLLGRTSAETIGQPLDRVSTNHAQILSPLLTGEEAQYEVSFLEGVNAPVYEVTVSPMTLQNDPGSSHNTNHVISLHDITLRKEAESALEHREAIMAAISLAAEQFLRESSWEHSVPGVLERIGEAVGTSRVYVAMNYTDENGTIHTSLCYEWAVAGLKSRLNDPAMQHIPLRSAGLARWEEILKSGQSICGLRRDFPKSEQDFLENSGVLSTAVMPIFLDHIWWGFIGFDECTHQREWTTTELEALHAAANIFGSAETRARTEQKLLRRQHTLNLLQEIVFASLQSSDLTTMANTLVDRLGKLINANGCFLALWDDTLRQTIPLAAYGPYKDTYPSLKPQAGEPTFTASALEAGHTLVVEDVSTSLYVSKRIANTFSSRSVLVLPMIAGTKPLGAIMLGFDRPHHFQPDEIEISEQAASLITLAVEKFQAVEHSHRRAEESETLRRAGAAITESLYADEALTRILEQLSEVIPYDSASVQLLRGRELEIVDGRGWENSSDVIGIRFPIPGDNPNSVVIETGKPYILPDAGLIYSIFRNPPHNHIHSWMGIPLIVRDRVLGLLAIDSAKPDHFTQENISLVSTFADQVAIALDNARLFKETQTQAITDPLTNIYNRRGLFDIGEFEFARARRLNHPFAAMILDIDHFKRVNDQYGHAAGDQALRILAERCRRSSRSVDLVGRYGGEEFVMLMPETDLEAGRLVAERLRQAITNEPFTTEAGSMRLTVSVGVAEMTVDDSLKSLIERADAALYEAKNSGRNRVASRAEN
jgi:diguanylate cyclase (GGDEF)-like protein/PAS domain S-box-containing protein